MAVRKRFKPGERAAFVVGAEVEWLNSSHWLPGVIVGPIEQDREFGWWRVGVENHARTRTVSPGEYISGSPGAVRLPITEVKG